MVLPLIGFGVAAGVVGVGRFVSNMMEADSSNERANKKTARAFNQMGEAQRKQYELEEQTKKSLEKLANRKRGILNTSMKNFISLYEKIKEIHLTESEGMSELFSNSLMALKTEEIKQMTSVAGLNLTAGENVAAFIFKGGISGIIAKEAELNEAVASLRKKQANVIASQAETNCTALDAIYQRSERLSEILTKLNILFMKSTKLTKTIIEEKQNCFALYTKEEKAYMMNCINFAKAVKDIIDTPLLNSESELTEQSREAISIGEKYLQKINTLVTED